MLGKVWIEPVGYVSLCCTWHRIRNKKVSHPRELVVFASAHTTPSNWLSTIPFNKYYLHNRFYSMFHKNKLWFIPQTSPLPLRSPVTCICHCPQLPVCPPFPAGFPACLTSIWVYFLVQESPAWPDALLRVLGIHWLLTAPPLWQLLIATFFTGSQNDTLSSFCVSTVTEFCELKTCLDT